MVQNKIGFKKIISLLLVLVFSIPFFAFASEEQAEGREDAFVFENEIADIEMIGEERESQMDASRAVYAITASPNTSRIGGVSTVTTTMGSKNKPGNGYDFNYTNKNGKTVNYRGAYFTNTIYGDYSSSTDMYFFFEGTFEVWYAAYNYAGIEIERTPSAYITVKNSITPGWTDFTTAMTEGDTYQFKANMYGTVQDNRGNLINDSYINWSSSNTSVATVSRDGEVTAKTAGTAVITAKSECENYTLTKTVTVSAPVVNATAVTLSPGEKTIDVGETVTITGTVTPSNTTDKNSTWSVNDGTKASLSTAYGTSTKVTGLAPGAVIVTASTHNNKTAQSTLTILQPAAGISIGRPKETINVGEEMILTPQLSPANVSEIYKAVTWSMKNDDTSIAAVDGATGKVTGVSPGTATVIAETHNGHKAETTVIVEIPVSGVKINPSSVTIKAGQPYKLEAITEPFNATNQDIVFDTENRDIIRIIDGANGWIEGIEPGVAVVTAAAGGKIGFSVITVEPAFIAPAEIQFKIDGEFADSLTVEQGDNAEITAVLLPEGHGGNAADLVFTADEDIFFTLTGTGGTRTINAVRAGQTNIRVSLPEYGLENVLPVTVGTKYINAETIDLTGTPIELTVGEKRDIEYKVYPSDATNKDVQADSLNEEFITIDKGTLSMNAIAPGTAKINVYVENTRDGSKAEETIEVTVVPAPRQAEKVEILMESTELKVGNTYSVKYRLDVEDAENQVEMLYSSDPDYVAVIDNETVKAVEAGPATLYAFLNNGVIGEIQVEAIDRIPVKEIILDMPSELVLGEEYELIYSVLPKGADDEGIEMLISDPGVLRQTGPDSFEAIDTGWVTVYVFAENMTVMAEYKTKVIEEIYVPLQGITVTDVRITMAVGDEPRKINVAFNPENATNKDLTYHNNSGTAYFDIDSHGFITPKAPGYAAVIIRSVEGNYMGFSNITIEGAGTRTMASAAGQQFDMVLEEGAREELAYDGEGIWYSSDESVMTVKNGVLTAKNQGTAMAALMNEDLELLSYLYVAVK